MNRIVLSLIAAFVAPLASRGATSIDSANHYAYGANIGWVDWRGDLTNGAVITPSLCSGYLWAANVGWINLGNGSPPGGQYANSSATNFGINCDATGNLRGFAYGANIGWIAFESNGAPRVDLGSGRLAGFAWSANCGWISLSNASTYVQTATVAPVDSDGDGIPDAWELAHFGDLTTATATSDTDGDGQTDLQEYFADTDPLNPGDVLKITIVSADAAGTAVLTWPSRPTRQYYILMAATVVAPYTTNVSLGLITPDAGSKTSRTVTSAPANTHFFKIQAVPPAP